MSITTGTEYTHPFKYSQEEVNRFAEVTGDNNPIHSDEAYAATTMFKKPIMHGFLGGSVFSKVFGTLFPGKGTIYLKQSMTFTKPMLVDTQYEARFKIIEHVAEKHRASVETSIVEVETGDVCVKGEALVLNTEFL